MILIWSLILIALFVAFVSIVMTTLNRGISPMPTSSKVALAVEKALPEKISGKVYELGCGFGGLASKIALKHPEAHVSAYEVSPIPWFVAYFRKKLNKQENVSLYWEDFFRVSLEDASVVFCYLYPGAMERLKKKFEKELKPGTIVISNTFAIPGWEPEELIKVSDLYRTKVYIYSVKNSSATPLMQ